MRWFNRNKMNILLIYLNILFILRVMKKAYKIEGYNIITVLMLITLGLFVYFIFHSVFYRSSQKVTVFLVVTAGLLGLSILYREFLQEFFLNNIVKNIEEINILLINGKSTSFSQYIPVFSIAIPIITVLLLWFSARGFLDGAILLNFGGLMFLWMLDYVKEVKSSLFFFSVLSIATYSINNHNIFMNHLDTLRIKRNIRPIKVGIPITIFAVVISVIIVIMPQESQGKYSKVITEKFNNRFTQGNSKGNSAKENNKIRSSVYGLYQSGYSNTEKKLGGPLTLNSDPVFKVESDKSYYLKGSTKEIYTGTSWKTDKDNFLQTGEFMISKTQVIKDNILNNKTLVIYPENRKDSSIFVPNYPLTIKSNRGDIYINEENQTAVFSNIIDKSYSVNFIEESHFLSNIKLNKTESTNIRELLETKKEYLEIPESISLRTIELVEKIIEGSISDYEKAEKIRSYISKNYPYSLNVSEVPEGKDFIDYYLFEEKKGYCVYSATAFTMMLRIAGIPARYVEGFKMSSEKDGSGLYNVTNEDAHAWTEAYLSDGQNSYWITLDTSTTPREQRLINSNTGSSGDSQEELPVPQQPKPQKGSSESQEESQEQTEPLKNISLGIILISVIVFLAILKEVYNRYKYYKIIRSRSILPLYKHALKRIKLLGYKKSLWNTDREFVKAINNESLKRTMEELVEFVYEEYYGGLINDSDKRILEQKLEESIKISYKNNIKYYIYRFILY